MTDYTELVKALRDDNACLSIKTAHNAADAIEELQQPGWISVKERLPEPGKYLVLKTSELSGKPWYYWQIVSYANNLNKVDKYDFPGKEYKRPGWYSYDSEYGHYETGDEITHWMPLPAPPKEDET